MARNLPCQQGGRTHGAIGEQVGMVAQRSGHGVDQQRPADEEAATEPVAFGFFQQDGPQEVPFAQQLHGKPGDVVTGLGKRHRVSRFLHVLAAIIDGIAAIRHGVAVKSTGQLAKGGHDLVAEPGHASFIERPPAKIKSHSVKIREDQQGPADCQAGSGEKQGVTGEKQACEAARWMLEAVLQIIRAELRELSRLAACRRQVRAGK